MRPPREVSDFVDDMIQAGEDILAETAGLSPEAFAANRRLSKAVIRDFEVLGEAAGKIPAELRSRFAEIDWRMLTAMRNRLIHAYFGIDLGIVHATAIADVPPLLPVLRRLRAALDAGSV